MHQPRRFREHQPRAARDAADALKRRGVVAGPSRVQAGARAAVQNPARGLVQLKHRDDHKTALVCASASARLEHEEENMDKQTATKAGATKRVLIVDDEPNVLSVLRAYFASFHHGHAYWTTTT